MTYKILHGNNLDILPTLPDNSVDSIVTDPPYELGFMGKKWDSSGIAYSVELWQQCLRVLKPGGHLLSFGGSRTYHRMVVAIEDAGFEIRDMISWVSNKTFPKSLDIGKAIDKGQGQNRDRQLAFTAWMRKSGLSQIECAQLLQPFAKNLESARAMAQHYYSDKQQPAIATADIFDWLRPYLPEVPETIERLVAERTGIEWTAYKDRKVIGQRLVPEGHAFASEKYGNSTDTKEINETLATTPEAKQWDGWGTALKPTVEPIVMARKPVEGTVAANVLKWGTGGLNIDGSRISANGDNLEGGKRGGTDNEVYSKGLGDSSGKSSALDGRWPANIILDPYTAELLDEQSGQIRITEGGQNIGSFNFAPGQNTNGNKRVQGKVSMGGASRFFYVAKASKRDRNEGLEASNSHPTVKPTTLMEYLIKLVTPPGGLVLDPFTGSGSTGKAAILQGFDFIGIEMTEEYLPIIEGRLKHAEQLVAEAKEQDKAKENEVLF
jgi:DNA modification methylase